MNLSVIKKGRRKKALVDMRFAITVMTQRQFKHAVPV